MFAGTIFDIHLIHVVLSSFHQQTNCFDCDFNSSWFGVGPSCTEEAVLCCDQACVFTLSVWVFGRGHCSSLSPRIPLDLGLYAWVCSQIMA